MTGRDRFQKEITKIAGRTVSPRGDSWLLHLSFSDAFSDSRFVFLSPRYCSRHHSFILRTARQSRKNSQNHILEPVLLTSGLLVQERPPITLSGPIAKEGPGELLKSSTSSFCF